MFTCKYVLVKGCFIVQRRFVYIGHEIARQLLEKSVISDACAYVQGREGHAFLESQKDFSYSGLLFDEAIHDEYSHVTLDREYLSDLEKRLGVPSLWQIINPDRIVRFGQLVREYPHDISSFSHEDMLKMVQVHARRIEAFLDVEKPDFLFTAQPGAVGTMLLFFLARARGIKTLCMMFPGFDERTCVSERYDRLTFVDARFESYKQLSPAQIPKWQEAEDAIRAFRDKPRVYSRIYDTLPKASRSAHFKFLLPQGLHRSMHWFTQIWVRWFFDHDYRHDYTTIRPWNEFLDRVKRKIRMLVGYDDFYSGFDPGQPFVFFPLHLEPEVALTIQSPFTPDQIEIIRHVAQSLPVGYVLVVKEHPQMVSFRPRSFYKALKKIPNVRIVNPRLRALDIVPHAALVTTIAGSTGFETVLLRKPVITFGEVIYNTLSCVLRCETPSQLPSLIRTQLSNPLFDEAELTRFVAAMLAESVRIDVGYLWTVESDPKKRQDGLRPFVDLIEKGLTR